MLSFVNRYLAIYHVTSAVSLTGVSSATEGTGANHGGSDATIVPVTPVTVGVREDGKADLAEGIRAGATLAGGAPAGSDGGAASKLVL